MKLTRMTLSEIYSPSPSHWVLLLFFVLFTFATYSTQNEIVVSVTGEDTPTCGSTTSPCASIEYAVSLSVPGDTVQVEAGSFSLSQPITLPNDVLLTGATCFASGEVSTNITIVPNSQTAMITMNYNSTLMCLSISQTSTSTEKQSPIIYAMMSDQYSEIIIQSCQFQAGTGGIRVYSADEYENPTGVLWLYDVVFSTPGGVLIDGDSLSCSSTIDDPLSAVSLILDHISISNSSFPLITGNFSPLIQYTNMELDLIKGEQVINTTCQTKLTVWENNQISHFTNSTNGVTYDYGKIVLQGESVLFTNFSYINSVNGMFIINENTAYCNQSNTGGCSLYMANVIFSNVTSNYAGFYIYNARDTLIENNSFNQFFFLVTYVNNEEGKLISSNTTMRNCTWSLAGYLTVTGSVMMDDLSLKNGDVFLSGSIHLTNSYFYSDYSSSGIYLTGGDIIMENVDIEGYLDLQVEGPNSFYSTNIQFNGFETKEPMNGLISCLYTPMIYMVNTVVSNYVISDDNDRDVISIVAECAIIISGGSFTNVSGGNFIGCSTENSVITFNGNSTEFSDCHFSRWWDNDDCTLACTSNNDHVCDKATERTVLIWVGSIALVLLVIGVCVGGAVLYRFNSKKKLFENNEYDPINE